MASYPTDTTAMLNSYRIFLSKLADEFTKKNLVDLKYLITDFVPAGILEKIVDGHSYLETLEQNVKISQNDLSYLSKLLNIIGRKDLEKKIFVFEEENVKVRRANKSSGIVEKIDDGYDYLKTLEQSQILPKNDLRYHHKSQETIGRRDLDKRIPLFEEDDKIDRSNNLYERNEELINPCKSNTSSSIIQNSSTKKLMKPTDFKKNTPKLPSENTFNSISYEEMNIAHNTLSSGEIQLRSENLLLPSSSKYDGSYSMNRIPCGICYIVDNNFSCEVKTPNGKLLDARHGTEKDVFELQNTFSWLNFKVITKHNVEAENILKIIKSPQEISIDCFVCCILSHGFYDGVYGSDGKEVTFNEMQLAINGNSAQWLVGKPKLFFIQACQGDEEEKEALYQDSPLSSGNQTHDSELHNRVSLAEDADICFSVATTPGKVSYRHSSDGSWYIQTLCHVLKKRAENMSLTDMLLEINKIIAEKADKTRSNVLAKQMSSMRCNTLRMPLYFKPKESLEGAFRNMSINELPENIDSLNEEDINQKILAF